MDALAVAEMVAVARHAQPGPSTPGIEAAQRAGMASCLVQPEDPA